jgi:Mn2+/Fe2+ NRAMP family transporter
MLRLVNSREIMGEHVNGRVYNLLAWGIAGIVSLLSLVLIGMTVADWLR